MALQSASHCSRVPFGQVQNLRAASWTLQRKRALFAEHCAPIPHPFLPLTSGRISTKRLVFLSKRRAVAEFGRKRDSPYTSSTPIQQDQDLPLTTSSKTDTRSSSLVSPSLPFPHRLDSQSFCILPTLAVERRLHPHPLRNLALPGPTSTS